MLKNLLIGLSALSVATTPALADNHKPKHNNVVQVQPRVVYTQPRTVYTQPQTVYTQPRSSFGIYIGTNPYRYNQYGYNYPYNDYRFYSRGYYGVLYPQYDGTFLCYKKGRYGIVVDAYGRPLTEHTIRYTPRSQMRCYTRY